MKRLDWMELIKTRPVVYMLGLCLLLFINLDCMTPSFSVAALDEEVSASSPPDSTGEYGKFVVYKVGNGKVKTLAPNNEDPVVHHMTYHHVTDLPYLPTTDPSEEGQMTWNYTHCSDGYERPVPSVDPVLDPESTVFYKDLPTGVISVCKGAPPNESITRNSRSSSDHPEAIVLNNKLNVYYTNPPAFLSGWVTSAGSDYYIPLFPCPCPDRNCPATQGKVGEEGTFDLPDDPNPGVASSIMSSLNCISTLGLSATDAGGNTVDDDWISIPISAMSFGDTAARVPLKIRAMGDRLNSKGTRTIQLTLYRAASGGLPVTEVARSRFGLDMFRNRDPHLGYICDKANDYWLKVEDWTTRDALDRGITPPENRYDLLLLFEATPVEPVSWDPTAYISRGRPAPAKPHYNPGLDNATFEPDDVTTPTEDLYPDCDGLPDSGDEGDLGISEVCPISGFGGIYDNQETGLKDGVLEYWEVDNKDYLDDGEVLKGETTNLSSMGNEAPSLIQVGNKLWMFVSTGSGIFQLTSLDGLTGLEWDLSNITNNRPSLLPRRDDADAPGEPEAPVVSSGKYGFCDTTADANDLQVTAVGKGYKDSICITFGEDGVMNSYPMSDQLAGNTINSGPDGIINTFIMPNCIAYGPPLYSNTIVPTEAPGNPDLTCVGHDPAASDKTAFLMGNDQWLTNEIGINPPEYWRRQNCSPFAMADEFNKCALSKTNTTMAVSGAGNYAPFTVSGRLDGKDHFCTDGFRVGICPDPLDGKFDQPGVENILSILRAVPQDDDTICLIPAAGLEYARFLYSNTVQLKHSNIEPNSEIVVSLLLSVAGSPAELPRDQGYYSLDPATGTISMGGTDWLAGTVFDGWPRTKDVLMVYYRYQGTQYGICPGPDGQTNTSRAFSAFYKLPDRNLGGPTIEMPPATGFTTLPLPILADTYRDVTNGSTVSSVVWDSGLQQFVCKYADMSDSNECPISPGSDETLDSAWLLDLNADLMSNHFDIYGQFDDWLCPIVDPLTGHTVKAICPGGNGYFQIYRLWKREEMEHYEGVDELIAKFKDPHNPCYNLEMVDKRSHFYENDESEYVMFAYQGLMGDDRVAWDQGRQKYILTTGTNGINQSCLDSRDPQLIPRYKGQPYVNIVRRSGVVPQTPILSDTMTYIEIEGEKPLPKILSGEDGICNSYRLEDDRSQVFMGTGAPDYPCVKAGPDGIANTKAQGNDSQLYLENEKTGFDVFGVETPEVVAYGDQLYLYYAGLGWLNAPEQVRPGRGALAKLGECRKPGLDNKWGNLAVTYDMEGAGGTGNFRERTLVTSVSSDQPNAALLNALDDNQGVALASRIGVAMSTISRVAANPTDWDRVRNPVIDLGRVCHGSIGGSAVSFIFDALGVGGGVSETAPSFNYMGSFSPDVLIKEIDGADKPLFMMWLTGEYSEYDDLQMSTYAKDEGLNGLYDPVYQIGLARSVDGVNFDTTNDINPLIVLGDFLADVLTTLSSVEDKSSFLNATVFPGAEEETYGMIFKMTNVMRKMDRTGPPQLPEISKREWLAFGVRNGFLYSGGLTSLISCSINAGQLKRAQIAYDLGAGAILLLPVIGLLILRLRNRKKAGN